MVGFSSDTTNVMVGEYQSIFSHLKNDSPAIACIKCSCHMIHLAASKACLKLPKHVEDLLRNIGSHFNRSYKRQSDFLEFQEFFKTEIHKILSPATTRWLSVKQCVDRILEQYEPLKAYFTQTAFDDPSYTLQTMMETLNNRFTKIYLEFMSYILEILCDFNLIFQKEKPLLHKLKPEVEKLLKDVCLNFMDVGHVRTVPILKVENNNPRHFLNNEQIYLGVLATESLNELKRMPDVEAKDIEAFFKSILAFYVELVSVIKNKFDFKDEVYNVIAVVEPKTAQEFKIKSLENVVRRFPILEKYTNAQALDNEWKAHALLNHKEEGLDASKHACDYWKQVFKMRTATGQLAFKNLCTVFKLLFVLPFSNASVERVFSNLKNIKTYHRNCLKTETVVALMATKDGVSQHNGCVNFEPSKKMLKAPVVELVFNKWQETYVNICIYYSVYSGAIQKSDIFLL